MSESRPRLRSLFGLKAFLGMFFWSSQTGKKHHYDTDDGGKEALDAAFAGDVPGMMKKRRCDYFNTQNQLVLLGSALDRASNRRASSRMPVSRHGWYAIGTLVNCKQHRQ